MKKINEQKFLDAYEVALKAKEAAVAEKEAALNIEKEKVSSLEGYSDHVKEILLAEVIAEKEKEFDLSKLDADIATFEQFLEDVEEEIVETVESEPVIEESVVEEQKFDEFGNPIN